MPRVRLTDAEREERRKARWGAILGQTRDYAVPTAADFVEEFRRRFGGNTATASADALLSYFGLPEKFNRKMLRDAFGKKLLRVHPDHGGTDAAARECVANYEALERRL